MMHRRFLRNALLVLLMMASVLPLSARRKKKIPGLALRPNQIVSLANVPQLVAGQPCENWAWVAALEALLAPQQAQQGQQYWMMKTYGGEICRSEPASIEDLQRVVNNDFTLATGRRVRFELTYSAGAPSVVDNVIAPLRNNIPLVLVWNNRPYLLYAMVYDEYITSVGGRIFEVKEFQLLDLRLAATDPARKVSFVAERDDADQINGVLQLAVLPR